MKWIAAILLVLNVLVFLGISDRQIESVPGRGDARPDVNRESMLLIKEVSDGRETVTSPSAPPLVEIGDFPSPGTNPADDLPATVLTDDRPALLSIDSDGMARIETPAPPAETAGGGETAPTTEVIADAGPVARVADVAPDYSCYRIGPFRDTESWNTAVSWVTQQEWPYQRVRSESRELRAVRVYIGPYESIGASQSTTEMLKEKELDHFVYLREGKARISLGYFTQEELAGKYVEYLNGLGIDARSQPEYRTLGPFDWMDVKVDSRLRRSLLEQQWDGEGVRTAEKDCRDFSAG